MFIDGVMEHKVKSSLSYQIAKGKLLLYLSWEAGFTRTLQPLPSMLLDRLIKANVRPCFTCGTDSSHQTPG